MRVSIMSDIHDNISNLKKAIKISNENNVEQIIFCGDFCSPIPARIFGEFKGDVHIVFGNGDGDPLTIQRFAYTEFPNLKIHGQYAELDINGKKIGVTHYPIYGRAMAKTGDYDSVFYGHSHDRAKERFGECLCLNPGEIMGWKGKASFAIYDTKTNTAEIFEI